MDRIETAINNLIINENEAIKSRIEEVRYCIDIPETNSKGYCYCLKVDANGRLRLQDLIEYIDFRFFVKFGGNLFFISMVFLFFFLNPIKSCRYVCFLVTLKTPHH